MGRCRTAGGCRTARRAKKPAGSREPVADAPGVEMFLRRGVGKHAGDQAQVVERPALGGRGFPRAPVPIDVLVQRERVRHVDDQTGNA